MTDRVPMRVLLGCSAPALLTAILCLAPFLNKAFTIDDAYFLTEAQQAVRTPLTPAATSICWENTGHKRSLRQVGSPAVLMAYSLIPVILLNGQEWVGHLFILVLFCAGAISTVRLSFRCGLDRRGAMWAGLFYASTPVLLAMAGTVMPDVPVTALAVVGIERLMAWREEGRWSQAIAAGAALGLAPMGRVHTLSVIGVGALLLLGDAWPKSIRAFRALGWRRWLPVVAGLAFFLSATWLTSDHSPASKTAFIGPNPGQWGLEHVDANLPQYGIDWLFTTPLGFAWLALAGQAGVFTMGAMLFVLAGLDRVVGWFSAFRYSVGLLGILVVVSVLWWAWKKPAKVWLCLALWLLIPLPIVVYLHLPPKYLAPCIPAAAILLAERLARVSPSIRTGVSLLIAVCGAVGGLLLLHADTEFSGLARRVVAENAAPRMQPGHRLWYSGQWALLWYAEKAGGSCLTVDPPLPQPGDVLVAGQIEGGVDVVDAMNLKLRLVETISPDTPGGRIMNPPGNIAFYSNMGGYLPWQWSSLPVNTYYVWIVE